MKPEFYSTPKTYYKDRLSKRDIDALEELYPIEVEKSFTFPMGMMRNTMIAEIEVTKTAANYLREYCESNNLVMPLREMVLAQSGADPSTINYVLNLKFRTRKITEDELYVQQLEYFINQ